MKNTFKMLLVLFLIVAWCVGCSGETEYTDENETEPAMIQTFTESDATVIPEIEIYDFMTAKDIREVQQIQSLQNGIYVGMAMEEVIEKYPDMAVMDFNGSYLDKEVTGNQGWNHL